MRRSSPLNVTSLADGLGLFSSAICLVHCLAVPTLLLAGVALPKSLLTDEVFHQAILWAILPAAVVAFGLGCRQHKDRWILILGALGLVSLSLSVTLLYDLLGETCERLVTVVSAIFLISAHIRNFSLCRSGHCNHDEA